MVGQPTVGNSTRQCITGQCRDTACKQAFDELKKWLVSTLLLAHFHPERPLRLETDASNGVITAIYSQKQLDGE